MENKGAASAKQLRNPDAFKTPNPSKPVKKAATVSAAGPFKARKVDTPLQSRSRSVKRSTAKKYSKQKQEEEVHPLAVAFKEKSRDYRRHLYSTAETKINNDLEALLNRLYESNLQVASSDSAENDPQASPLRLTAPAKYERLVENLCRPLTRYNYTLSKKAPSGETERFQTNLHDRFQAFEEYLEAETKRVKDLQRQWEAVVAEIFRLGVDCLGESDMATLLSTAAVDLNASSPSKAEPTVTVPENDVPDDRDKDKRKHVSFAGPDLVALFPKFLFTTAEPQKHIPAAPELPLEGVQRFQKEIAVLGKQHSVDLHRLEREHKAWWERKQKQLAQTLMEE